MKHLYITMMLLVLKVSFAQQPLAYPKVTGYFSIVQPLTTFSSGNFTSNFGKVYVVGFLFGINILKSDRFGISFEVAAAIRTEKNISKVTQHYFTPVRCSVSNVALLL